MKTYRLLINTHARIHSCPVVAIFAGSRDQSSSRCLPPLPLARSPWRRRAVPMMLSVSKYEAVVQTGLFQWVQSSPTASLPRTHLSGSSWFKTTKNKNHHAQLCISVTAQAELNQWLTHKIFFLNGKVYVIAQKKKKICAFLWLYYKQGLFLVFIPCISAYHRHTTIRQFISWLPFLFFVREMCGFWREL